MAAETGAASSQESMFIVGPGSGAFYEPTLFSHNPGAVDMLSRNLALQQVLLLMPRINELGGFEAALHTPERARIADRYKAGLANLSANSQAKLRRLDHEAREQFSAAFGLDEVKALGTMSVHASKASARESYGSLWGEYGGPEHAKARDTFLFKLVRSEIVIGNQRRGTPPKPVHEKPITELTHWEKLQVLHDSVNLHPSSHPEKTQALPALDCPSATQRLTEVFIHMKNVYGRQAGTKLGQEALRSLPLEFGDYLINAVQSIVNLRQLEMLVREAMNPNVTIEQEFGDITELKGFAELVRYIDQTAFLKTGGPAKNVKFDMFRSHRHEGPEHDDFKHKTIEDSYTGQKLRPAVKRHIKFMGQSLTVGNIRGLISQAVEQQVNRATFWETQLHDLDTHIVTRTSGNWALRQAQSVVS